MREEHAQRDPFNLYNPLHILYRKYELGVSLCLKSQSFSWLELGNMFNHNRVISESINN